jgi:DNA adenine methylase
MFDLAKEKLSGEQCLSQTERAIHYAIQRVQSFSGTGSSWAYRINAPKFSGKWLPFLNRLELINARIKKVQIECLDFEKVIKKYDSKSTLFYLDPPYIGGEKYYKTKSVNFRHEDHERLARTLKKIRGKFILSYYDHETIRKSYKAFRLVSKDVPKYCVGNNKKNLKKRKPIGQELLIMNY